MNVFDAILRDVGGVVAAVAVLVVVAVVVVGVFVGTSFLFRWLG